MKEFYDTLGCNETQTLDEIKSAFRKLAIQNHPDRGGDPIKFITIKKAYDYLCAHHIQRKKSNFNDGKWTYNTKHVHVDYSSAFYEGDENEMASQVKTNYSKCNEAYVKHMADMMAQAMKQREQDSAQDFRSGFRFRSAHRRQPGVAEQEVQTARIKRMMDSFNATIKAQEEKFASNFKHRPPDIKNQP